MKKLITAIVIIDLVAILTLVLISTRVHADGVDDAFHKQGGTWVLTPHDINYWRDFDKHPCKYDLGYNEHECIEKPDRYSWNKPENWRKEPIGSVPEPEILGLLGVGISAFVAFKNWRP